MTWHWKELLPVDQFSVRTSQYITEMDRLTLTMLYQPLIGAISHSLYVTLFSQLERDQYWSAKQTHRQLMILLGVPLQVIFEERKKLEGIGLLTTFQSTGEDDSTYIYELQPPMTPKQFFENDVLSVYLFNRLGKTAYRQLRERFIIDTIPQKGYKEVTKAFDEVYTSLHHSEMVSRLQSETGNALQMSGPEELIDKEYDNTLSFSNDDFDFDLFDNSLSKTIVPDGVLTNEAKQIIGRLAFVYQMEPLEMSSLVSQVLLHSHELDENELRKRAQDWYKIEHGSTPPSLGLRTHPERHRMMSDKEPTTEEERTIKFYETTSPLALLEIRATDGGVVANADVKIAESLIMDHKLLPGVANVLLDFMLWTYDMKLPKALVDKVAGHWSRKKMKTVKEAMAFALSEQQKVAEATETRGYARRSNRAAPRRDTLPKWLLAEKEKKRKSEDNKVQKKAPNKSSFAKDKSFEQMLKELNKQ